MNNSNPFFVEGTWFKGNLHLHTTNSDGKLRPEVVAKLYKDNGWNFIAFTDHNFYTDTNKFDTENFIVIPGVELDTTNDKPLRIYHVVGIGADEKDNFTDSHIFERPEWRGKKTAQGLIDKLTSKNNFAVFCHPNWSRLEFSDFSDLKGFSAIEIYNFGCDVENRTGLSIDYWDSLLRRGRKIWGVATDDAHHLINDRCGGWIMVKCKKLSRQSIMNALQAGSFYSSQGPEIYEFKIIDNEVHIECSPVKAIHIVAFETHGHSFIAEEKRTITSARYKLKGTEDYIRVECVDKLGKIAWTNPIFLKDIT